MRTVLATSFTPTLDSGRARRTYGIVSALAKHGPVDIVYGAFGAREPDPAYGRISGVRLYAVLRPRLLRRVPAYLRARIDGVPSGFARGIWPGLTTHTAALARNGSYARVIAEGPVAAAALLPFARRHTAIYSAHNLESSFRHRLDGAGMSLTALQRFEKLLLDSYAESWMVSPVDIAGAVALDPRARLRLVPNVIDCAAIEPVPPRRGERIVLFVADLTYEPNREALAFLLDAVMPNIWRQAPDVQLVVAGNESDSVESADPRVEARGYVPDLRPLYEAAGCAVVPLLTGGGSPLKFVEALAFKVPVVATPLAAAGLEVSPGVNYAQAAADGESFAQAVLETLDPARGNPLAVAGRRLAESEYSIEALERRLAP